MARNSKFSKNTLFYQVFHSPEFSDNAYRLNAASHNIMRKSGLLDR